MNTPKLPDKPQQFIKQLHGAGYEAYAVGGCVRDLLMNRPTHDWDFTTNAKPDEIMKLFPKDSFYNNTFGTVGVNVKTKKGTELYEITTYRTEHSYSNKRHPDNVSWGSSLQQDLARRDFTIGAIAYDGATIVDPYNGRSDITNKLVQAVGDPVKRFQEDALRLLRAVRIATQLGFMIEKQTRYALEKNAELITAVSKERVRDELIKILESDHPADGFLLLKNVGLLHYIIPELEPAFDTPQKSPKRHHIYDVGTHLIESLRNCKSDDPIVRFATLLHDIGKPKTFHKTKQGVITFYNHEVAGASMTRTIARRLRFSRNDTGRLIRLVRWHQFSVDERQTDKAIRRFIRRVGKENIQDMLDLRVGDRLGGGARETSWRLELYKKRIEEVQKQPFQITDLRISGNDVKEELGIKPGPKVGHILQQLFDEVVDQKRANKRSVLLKRLKELAG